MKHLALCLGVALLAGGCGAREELKPATPEAMPPAPYGAAATPSPGDLLQPPVQTRPARSDDLIESSDERRSDKFDLPPN